jgi:hypothetical protein
MLLGTADVEELAQDAPRVEAFWKDPVALDDVACLQVTAELRNDARESQLPPGLHPTIPPAFSLQVYDVGGSPWGSFRMATLRLSCRSGVRARGFTRATLVDGAEACSGLRECLGFPSRPAGIAFRRGYDRVSVAVVEQDRTVLDLEALDPEPLALDDVQFTGTLNLAHTPLGLRLMQVEMSSEPTRVERLEAHLEQFEPAAWGDPRLKPARVIAASLSLMSALLPPVRFVCRPDELAFTGTEPVE